MSISLFTDGKGELLVSSAGLDREEGLLFPFFYLSEATRYLWIYQFARYFLFMKR